MNPRKILKLTAVFFAVFFILENSSLYAGGAAAAKKRRGPAQQAAQQKAIQQRALQQALMQRRLAEQGALQSAGAGPELQMHGQIRPASGGTHLPVTGEIGGRVNVVGPEGEVTQNVLVSESIDESQVKDIVNIEDLWKTFETTSENWPLIMETRAKILTVDRAIYQHKEKGATISNPPLHYVQMIDVASAQNPALLNQPFNQLLQLMAIMEYDFDNGTDRDQLAQKLLGEQGWKSNRHRLGLE